jgi:hypothetical protein
MAKNICDLYVPELFGPTISDTSELNEILFIFRLMMPVDLLYSFVLTVFGFAIGFIGGQDEQGDSSSNPQRKIDFHIRILGLLVELTVDKMTLDQNSNV